MGRRELGSCRGIVISFPFVTFNSEVILQKSLSEFYNPLNINLALTSTLHITRGSDDFQSEQFLVSVAKLKFLKAALGIPRRGRESLIISLFMWTRLPLRNELVHGQLTALTKLGDETIKLAVMEKLAASFSWCLKSKKNILVNVWWAWLMIPYPGYVFCRVEFVGEVGEHNVSNPHRSPKF